MVNCDFKVNRDSVEFPRPEITLGHVLRIINVKHRNFLLANNILLLESHSESSPSRRFHVPGDLG
jgi:hypothetical protein